MIEPYSNTKDSWKGAKNFGKIICIDFDGVIAQFDGWKGPNVFGEPIKGAYHVMNQLAIEGWYIIIFTTRLVTIELVQWLNDEGIPYDDINGRRVKGLDGMLIMHFQSYDKPETNSGFIEYESVHQGNFYWMHNPEYASIKPIASVYLDDMSWENEGKNYTRRTWFRVLQSLYKRFPDKVKNQ